MRVRNYAPKAYTVMQRSRKSQNFLRVKVGAPINVEDGPVWLSRELTLPEMQRYITLLAKNGVIPSLYTKQYPCRSLGDKHTVDVLLGEFNSRQGCQFR